MFGKRTAEKVAALPVIIVPQSAYDSDKDYSLPGAVVDFVNHALGHAQFRREEIPLPAMQAFHVDYYIAQVNNGGHSQYVGNSSWHQYQIDDIRAGLGAIGIEDGIELYEDLCAFADSHPEEFRAGMDARGFGEFPEFFDKADKLFFAGLNDRLMKGNSDWIRSLDCLLVLENGQYRKVMTELPGRNPLAAQRGAEGEARAKDKLDGDPIVQACRCLGLLSAPVPANVQRWLQMIHAEGPSGENGYNITVEIEGGGTGTAWLFPTFGALSLHGQAGKSNRVPIDMIQEWVKRATGDYIPKEFWR
jgi:hypothetical protein